MISEVSGNKDKDTAAVIVVSDSSPTWTDQEVFKRSAVLLPLKGKLLFD